jgi:hypothetical protein
MTWRRLLAEGRIVAHRTSAQEIASLRAIAERSLRDAVVPGLSADASFLLAHGSALILSRIVVAAAAIA